jgi:hypothetical protein
MWADGCLDDASEPGKAVEEIVLAEGVRGLW